MCEEINQDQIVADEELTAKKLYQYLDYMGEIEQDDEQNENE